MTGNREPAVLGRLRNGTTAVVAGLRCRVTAALMEDGMVVTLAPLAWTLTLLVLYQGEGLENLFLSLTGPWCSVRSALAKAASVNLVRIPG